LHDHLHNTNIRNFKESRLRKYFSVSHKQSTVVITEKPRGHQGSNPARLLSKDRHYHRHKQVVKRL